MFLQYRNPYTEPAEITDTIKLAFRRRQYTNRDEARFIFSLQNYRHRRNSNSQKRPEQGWAQMQVFFMKTRLHMFSVLLWTFITSMRSFTNFWLLFCFPVSATTCNFILCIKNRCHFMNTFIRQLLHIRDCIFTFMKRQRKITCKNIVGNYNQWIEHDTLWRQSSRESCLLKKVVLIAVIFLF